MKRSATLLLPVLAFLAGAAVGLRAGDWQSLLGNSPFGVPPAATPPGEGDLEFRAVVAEEGVTLVNLFNPVTKKAQWLPVHSQAGGIEVNAYDAASGRLQITQEGRPLSLSLKQARVTLASNTASLQLTTEPDKAAADLPEFMRNLPPEARRLLEDVRRRRALRPPFPGTEPDAAPSVPAPPPPAR